MKKLKPCPFCGGEATISDGGYSGEKFLARCRDLSCPAASGFIRKTHDEAVEAWNRRAQPENKPLTLDELKQMDGEPVWIVLISVCDGYWDICKRNDYDGGDYIDFARIPLKKKYYEKTWLAYRRAQQKNEPPVRCGECAKHQSPNCAAKHEQALMDFCSHGVRKPERSKGE